MDRVEPRVLKGFRDFNETEMTKRKHVEKIVRSVFSKFGYAEIETPILEYSEILLGKYGEEGEKLTYSFTDNGDRKISMRYDQTVPFARYVAENLGIITRPFKRFQIGSVFRADKPQKGRYRQFTQCDIDIIGSDSILSDFEVLQVAVDIFKDLNIQGVKIKFSDRKFLDSLMNLAKVSESNKAKVISSIDKIAKIGIDKCLDECKDLADISLLKQVLISEESIYSLEKKFELDCSVIKNILEMSSELGLEKYIYFDPSISRGLDYYTGMVFETFVVDSGIGSICSGGRYDNLLSMFSKEELSGVGFGLGFDRLIDVMEEQGLLSEVVVNSEYLVTVFDESLRLKSQKIANFLRQKGIGCEIYLGNNLKLAKQFQYAEKRNITSVVIVGQEEQALFEETKELVVKNLKTGEQKRISL